MKSCNRTIPSEMTGKLEGSDHSHPVFDNIKEDVSSPSFPGEESQSGEGYDGSVCSHGDEGCDDCVDSQVGEGCHCGEGSDGGEGCHGGERSDGGEGCHGGEGSDGGEGCHGGEGSDGGVGSHGGEGLDDCVGSHGDEEFDDCVDSQDGEGCHGGEGSDGCVGSHGGEGSDGGEGCHGGEGSDGGEGCHGGEGSDGGEGCHGGEGSDGGEGCHGGEGSDGGEGCHCGEGSDGGEGCHGGEGSDGGEGCHGGEGSDGGEGCHGGVGSQGGEGCHGDEGSDGGVGSHAGEGQVKISDNYTNIPYGIQPRASYEHGKSESDIMGVTYNGRMRQFVILDSKGLTTWKRQIVDNEITRTLSYPKYEYKLITYLVYAKKYNCYFALSKDFSLKVMNHEFVETCSVSADMNSVLFLVFNPVRDELITGGVGGTKVWLFHQVTTKVFMEIKPLANFRLTLKYELPNVGGSWVKRVDLNHQLEHLYCCSDTDLFVYDMQGKLLLTYDRAHTMSITGCCYSLASKVLVTASVDSEVKVWSLSGGLVHTFRGHSRAVTSLMIHPDNSAIAITSSLDGTVRLWSLQFMDALYSMVVSADGVLWMGLTDDQLLYLATAHSVTLWSLNYFFQFWSMAHNKVTHLSLVGSEKKTTRVVSTSSDSSVRLFARSSHKNMSTVLPPPSISPLQKVLSVCYSRECNVVFLLVSPTQIWVYTTRTDPACRIAVWEAHELQMMHLVRQPRSVSSINDLLVRPSVSIMSQIGPSVHRAAENGTGNELVSNFCSLCNMNSSAMMWTDEGFACPIKHSYLLLGLEDGRILFMDPVIKGQKYMEFKASKDPIQEIKHDIQHNALITVCRLKELTLIQIWSLPELALKYEVYCASDVTGYARQIEGIDYRYWVGVSADGLLVAQYNGNLFMTGHESGNVIFYTLQPAHDTGLNKAKVVPEYKAVVDKDHRPDHSGDVVAVDSCSAMGLFCSCSSDGGIKIWECETLLTEIVLDESLSTACFLNNSADLLVGFKQHIFYIDHSRVCPHLTAVQTDVDTYDQESFVYEDPAVMYEGVMENPDPIDMDSYLVPYEIEFSKDFLEGKLELNPMVQMQEEESEEETDYLLAPTEVYISPCDTPSHLSNIDFTLDSEVTRFDLQKQMEQTRNTLLNKDHLMSHRRKKLVKGKPPMVSFSEDQLDTDDSDVDIDFSRFDFPAFGESPGPTPSPSITSIPASGSSAVSSDSGESSSEEPASPSKPVQPLRDLQYQEEWFKMIEAAGRATSVTSQVVKTQKPKAKTSSPTSKVSRPRISNVTIDVKNVMKDSRKVRALQKDADHSHVKPEGPELEEKKKENYYRDINKKKFLSNRQLPKRKKLEENLSVLDVPKIDEVIEQESTSLKDDTGATTDETVVKKQSHDASSSPPEIPHLQIPFVEEEHLEKPEQQIAVKINIPDLPVVPEVIKTQPRKVSETFIVEDVCPSKDVKASDEHPMKTSAPKYNTSLKFPQKEQQEKIKTDDEYDENVMDVAVRIQSLVAPAPPSSLQSESEVADMPDIPLVVCRSRYLLDTSAHSPPVPTHSNIEERSVPIQVVLPTAGDDDYQSSLGGSARTDGEIVSMSHREEDTPRTVHDVRSVHRVQIQRHYSESRSTRARPASCFADTEKRQDWETFKTERPHTAAKYHFNKEDLQMAYNSALNKYENLLRTPLCPDKLYKNDGNDFADQWHERAIQRHMLIRMQKELRQHHATQKRHLLEHRLQERQQSLFGHAECSIAPATAKPPDISACVLDQLEKANSAMLRPPPSRAQSAASQHSAEHHKSRPHTVNVAMLQRKKQQEQPQESTSKTEKTSQMPFRLRISPVCPAPTQVKSCTDLHPHLMDPRNPKAIRPKSSKSIPSKCSRYVLVTKPKEKVPYPVPSPLEEQLMYERFPILGLKMGQQYDVSLLQHRPQANGIQYSPFAPQMF